MKRKFEKNTPFMLLNCIIFLIIAYLLRRIPFINNHDILGTVIYILLIIISAVIIYNLNFLIYKKINHKK